MENEPRTPIGILAELAVSIAVLAQAWVILNDATDGQAGRHVAWWWQRKGRPLVVRTVEWLDSKAITERMVNTEIAPYLGEGT